MDLQSVIVVVVDKSQFLKLVHEKTDPAASGTDHLCESFLIDFWDNGLSFAALSIVGQQQEQTSQTLFAVIEEVVHQILVDALVPKQQIRNESL